VEVLTVAVQCSALAEPPISDEEIGAVNMGRDTCICRWHGGQFTHLSPEGAVLYCPLGDMLWRYTKQPGAFLKPLQYPQVGV
jgi:hypothetical protein